MSVIAIDIDEVLSDTLTAFIGFHNSNYSTALTREDFHSYQFEDVLKIPTDQIVARILEFYLTDSVTVRPMPGASEVLTQLHSKYSLVAITARLNDLENYTREWMAREYPGLFDSIYFAHNVHVGCDRKMKHEYCQELGVDLLIDDAIEYLAPCAAYGIRTMLFHQPWNRTAEARGVQRVYSWEEIGKLLL